MLNRAALEHTLHSLHQARVHIAFFHALTSLSEEIGQRQELRGTARVASTHSLGPSSTLACIARS
jgi:hypothetical protein